MLRKSTRRTLGAAVALAILSSVFLPGCNANNSNTSSGAGADTSKHVTLKYYWFAQQVPSDVPRINTALNKLLNKKINADIQLVCVAANDYSQKLENMINAQENFDLAFTASWQNYTNDASKGAYVDLTSLLPKYAPKTWAEFKPEIWAAAKVDGKIYGSINQQIYARQSGFTFNKDLVTKYNFDYTKVKSFADLTPLLAAVKAGEPASRTTSLTDGMGKTFVVPTYLSWKWESTSSNEQLPGMAKSDEKNPKVFNQYATPEFKEMIDTMADWYKKGYIPQNILTTSMDWSQAPYGVPGTVKPGGEVDDAKAFSWSGGAVEQSIGDPTVTASSVSATMTSVSATSKNPERAVMYIELANSDKDVYNLIAHGEEGVDYTKTGDNRIEVKSDSKYIPNEDWQLGNSFIGYLQGSQADDLWAQTKKLNDSAYVSNLFGFVFDDTKVKTQEANCLAIIKQYAPALGMGTYGDQSDAKLTEFLAALKTAGSDSIIAEEQSQINAFLAKKK